LFGVAVDGMLFVWGFGSLASLEIQHYPENIVPMIEKFDFDSKMSFEPELVKVIRNKTEQKFNLIETNSQYAFIKDAYDMLTRLNFLDLT
jgi:hypothetical protein